MARSAKGKPARRTRRTGSARSHTPARRSVKRSSKKAQPKRPPAAAHATRKATAKKTAAKRPVSRAATQKGHGTRHAAAKRVIARKATPRGTTKPSTRPARDTVARAKLPRLDRARRTLDETLLTPPSSLDMDRRGSAARTGRAEIADSLDEHRGMAASIAGGDADVDVEDAYFTGDEAPGGDNPAPDEEVVDDIGKALGVQYEDHEELKASDKIVERDKHRWEMDPASSEDYKERK